MEVCLVLTAVVFFREDVYHITSYAETQQLEQTRATHSVRGEQQEQLRFGDARTENPMHIARVRVPPSVLVTSLQVGTRSLRGYAAARPLLTVKYTAPRPPPTHIAHTHSP